MVPRSVEVESNGVLAVSVPNDLTAGERRSSIGSISEDEMPEFVRREDKDTETRSSAAVSVTSSFAEDLEVKFHLHRHEIVRADGGINTPLGVLRDVAKEYGTAVHFEFHEVHISKIEKRYRVEVYVGRLKGELLVLSYLRCTIFNFQTPWSSG
jgi:hypothetical protein